MSFEAGVGVETGRVEGGKNKSLEITINRKGIFVLDLIFRLCLFAAASWIPAFYGNSAPNCKCLDYPLEVNRVMCIGEIYLLIPSTWNNLVELNLLITHQKTTVKA